MKFLKNYFDILVIILIVSGLVFFLFMEKNKKQLIYLDHTTRAQKFEFQAILFSLENTADTIFQNILNKEDILSIIARAKGAEKADSLLCKLQE